MTSLKVKESELQAQSRIYEAMHSALQDIIQPITGQPAGWHSASREPDAAGYEEAVVSRVIEIAREITGATWVEYYSYDAESRMLCLTGNAGMPQEFFCRPGHGSGTAWMRSGGLSTWWPGSANRCIYRTFVPTPGG